MATVLRIKRRSAAGGVGAPTTLAPAELAYNESSNILYYGLGDAGTGVSSSVVPIAGTGSFVTTSTTQTISGPKTFSSITITGGSITGITDLAIADGGTGASTAAAARTNLLPSFAGNAGKVLLVNAGATDVEYVTPNPGTVISIGMTVPSIMSVSGSPITSIGTLAVTLATQTANYIWAGPTTGAAATPTFRPLVSTDIPSLSYLPLSGGTVSGAVTISGDLTVSGTTTTVSSTTLTVADKNIELAAGSSTDAAADNGGITLHGLTDKTFNWVSSTSSWTSSENLNIASGKTLKINGTTVLSSTAIYGVDIDGGSF